MQFITGRTVSTTFDDVRPSAIAVQRASYLFLILVSHTCVSWYRGGRVVELLEQFQLEQLELL